MSQSATLYRISEKGFDKLENSNNKQLLDYPSIAKSHYVFQGTHLGLEYILSKGQDAKTIDLVLEIFNPQQSLIGQDFNCFSADEEFEFYWNANFISYINKEDVLLIDQLLDNFSETDIKMKFDADELNNSGIYPEVWHNNDTPNQAFNKRHIIEDFNQLKKLFTEGATDKDYIFVFMG